MWLSDRRKFLGGVVLATLSLTACGFTPVYGPQGSGSRLQGQVALADPTTPETYMFNRHFEERMGRATSPIYTLKVSINTDEKDQGATSSGNTTRFRVSGVARYTLKEGKTERLTHETRAFTGYSNTGSTVATMAAQTDAHERLSVILADQVIDELILFAADVPE